MKSYLYERLPSRRFTSWETIFIKLPSGRISLMKGNLHEKKNCPQRGSASWKAIFMKNKLKMPSGKISLMKGNLRGRLPSGRISLMKGNPHEKDCLQNGSPSWNIISKKGGPRKRQFLWKSTLIKDYPNEAIFMKDSPRKTTFMKDYPYEGLPSWNLRWLYVVNRSLKSN